jgi:hypothetical protein
MTDEFLDHLLVLWFLWTRGDRGVVAYADHSLVVGDFRGTAAQYESQLEAQDIRADDLRSAQVHEEVERMDEPYRTAIHCDAKNLHCGVAVWRSERLPKDPITREIVLEMARDDLKKRLVSAGIE